jgi:hypothetical protein
VKQFIVYLLLLTFPGYAATWSTFNGGTVGASSTNISSLDGKTIGTATGNYNSWNGLVSPGGGGGGTYTRIQEVDCGTAVANPPVITCTISSSGANNLFVVPMWEGTSTATLTPAASGITAPGCSGAACWICPANLDDANVSYEHAAVCYAYNIPSGITSVTITGSGFSIAGGHIAEYHDSAGAWGSDPLDQDPVFTRANVGAGTPWASTTTGTVTSGALGVGGTMESQGGGTSQTCGGTSGWTLIGTVLTAANGESCFVEQIGLSAATQQATGTYTATGPTNFKFQSWIATFKP